MYPIPPTETLVQTKTCRHCSASFPITDKDLEFYEKASPVFPLSSSWAIAKDPGNSGSSSLLDSSLRSEWQMKIEWDKIRYLIPPPTLCPDCRQQRRLSFRNERKLYKRKCDATNKDIISIYSPDKAFKVYHQDYWWSDKWDPMDYGRDFDFSRWFFEQFGEFSSRVPHMHKIAFFESENSEYTNYIGSLKNCYLEFGSVEVEWGLYGYENGKSKNVVDCQTVSEVSDSYECIGLIKGHNCLYVTDSENITNSAFVSNCRNLDHCFGCVSLSNQSYHILNTPVPREEYEKFVQSVIYGWREAIARFLQDFKDFSRKFPRRSLTMVNSENSVGDFLENCNHCYVCFQVWLLDGNSNLKYSYKSAGISDCYDVLNSGYNIALSLDSYNLMSNVQRTVFSFHIGESTDIYYSNYLTGCHQCFACIGLRNKSYCILNKQYTREEYEALVPKIIEHMSLTPNPSPFGGEGGTEWGEFFPSSLSPFGYNETVAMEYYPLSRRDVSEKHLSPNGTQIFNWSDYEAPFPKVEKIIPADKLPDDISKIPDDILNWAIECEVTKRPFRIIKQELEFYRKHNLPIPRRHPDQRHLDRMALRNPRKLFERKCDKCGVEMITTYAPERKEVVYCESCYNKEVVW